MRRTFVVGTAGHVDHGKSSLVRALTGIDPDRLAEEQRRQMTIDLGFADFVSPAGNHIHLVDVPGHERFVRNMLAGAGGIDAAMLVVAADDGPMPQTREHLAILDLLDIGHSVIAVTKIDLVDEPWVEMIDGEIRQLVAGTSLESSEIVHVSAVDGTGLLDLQMALDRALEHVTRPPSQRAARLPIDRVFTMPGFGTVVTGTLIEGTLHEGERVVVLPRGLEARIRGLQSFAATVGTAEPGRRVAVNLTGVDVDDLRRGDVLSHPGSMTSAQRLDVRLRLIADAQRPLAHNDEVVVFTGSSETRAKAAILDAEQIAPGSAGWVQLRLENPVAVRPGDRFILRRPSPAETIGGGTMLVLDPPRHRRFRSDVIDRLAVLAEGSPRSRGLAWLGTRFATRADVGASLDPEVVRDLVEERAVVWIGKSSRSFLVRSEVLDSVIQRMVQHLVQFHATHPLRPGEHRETLRRALDLERAVFDAVIEEMVARGDIDDRDGIVRLGTFEIELDERQRATANRFLGSIREQSFRPDLPADRGLDSALVDALVARGELVAVGDDIVFLPETIESARTVLLASSGSQNGIELAEYRDLLGTSRKFAQALLEYFDRVGVTRRIGDRRIVITAKGTGKEIA